MSDIERIRAAKREFTNKLNYVNYDEYNSTALKGVQLRVVGLDFDDDDIAIKVRNMIDKLIDSLDTISKPKSEKEWNSIVQNITDSTGIVEPNEKPYNSSEQASTIARIWNGILGLQYHIEEEIPIKE